MPTAGNRVTFPSSRLARLEGSQILSATAHCYAWCFTHTWDLSLTGVGRSHQRCDLLSPFSVFLARVFPLWQSPEFSLWITTWFREQTRGARDRSVHSEFALQNALIIWGRSWEISVFLIFSYPLLRWWLLVTWWKGRKERGRKGRWKHEMILYAGKPQLRLAGVLSSRTVVL